jgi:hypothetical protein
MHFICGVFCTVTYVRNFSHKSIPVSRVWNPLEGANHWMVVTIPNNGEDTFGDKMRKHFSEEEEIVFPLALKADSM